jgi:hypothetical protein
MMITPGQRADNEVKKRFAQDLLIEFKQQNLDDGITAQQALWLHHRARNLEVVVGGVPMTVDILNMAIVGDIEAAYVALLNCTPDDMSETFHWFNQSRIDFLKNSIAVFMGWL